MTGKTIALIVGALAGDVAFHVFTPLVLAAVCYGGFGVFVGVCLGLRLAHEEGGA